MPSIGLTELIIIAVIVLIFFGPGRLPELGSSMGKAVRGFRKSMSDPAEKAAEPTEEEPVLEEAASEAPEAEPQPETEPEPKEVEEAPIEDTPAEEPEEVPEEPAPVETLKTDLGAMSRYLMEEIRQKIREEGKMKNIKINLKRKEENQK